LFDRFIGAGEDARAALAARSTAFHRALGARCYAFTRDGDHSLIDGIGLEIVGSVEAADFIAVIGIDSPQRDLADYEPELRAGIARDLPLVCANPDVVRVSPQGTLAAPGALARRYEALGGRVFYHGKPYPAIYRTCLAAMPQCAPARVIAVGDSLEHDVLGATRSGLPSAFVAGGIHAEALVACWGSMPAPERWQQFLAGAAVTPDYLLPAFVW
jgi:HAD superfamily hydrolase (TIGR01459 family)